MSNFEQHHEPLEHEPLEEAGVKESVLKFNADPENFNVYFVPTIFEPANIQRITRLRSLGAGLTLPTLETYDDYLNYYNQFSDAQKKLLLSNLSAIELSNGCHSACKKVCSLAANSPKILKHIPYSFLIFLFEEIKRLKVFKEFFLYWATDLKYYKSEGKDSVDLIKAYKEYFGILPYISTSIGLDNSTIQFLARLLQENLDIDRISRLEPLHNIKLDSLLHKLVQHLGRALTEEETNKIESAFNEGLKDNGTYNIGNATKLKPNEAVSLYPLACTNGVFLKSDGFFGSVLVPANRTDTTGQVQYRILPDSEKFVVPKHKFMGNSFYLVTRPVFVHDIKGASIDSYTTQEKLIIRISEFLDAIIYRKVCKYGQLKRLIENIYKLFDLWFKSKPPDENILEFFTKSFHLIFGFLLHNYITRSQIDKVLNNLEDLETKNEFIKFMNVFLINPQEQHDQPSS